MTTTNAATDDAPKRRSWLAFCLSPKIAIPFTLVVLVLLSPVFYRAHRLNRIPEVEEPFDVEAFLDFEIDEEAGPWLEYAKAEAMLVDATPFRGTTTEENDAFDAAYAQGWSGTNDAFRKYLDANRPALHVASAAFRRDAVPYQHPRDRGIFDYGPGVTMFREFTRLGVIESERLFDEGQPREALALLHDMHRGGRLLAIHAPLIQRLLSNACHAILADPLARMAADDRIGADDLRVALDRVRENQQLVPPPSQTLKVEFIALMAWLDEAGRAEIAEFSRVSPWRIWIENEPAVTLRLLRHDMHWRRLTELDKPRYARSSTTIPPVRHLLAEGDCERFANESPIAREVLDYLSHFFDTCDRDDAKYRALECVLAAELHRRGTGAYPDELADLVPKYLDDVPLDPFGGPGDTMNYALRDGRPVVWSIGEDGIDNGGVNDHDAREYDWGINILE